MNHLRQFCLILTVTLLSFVCKAQQGNFVFTDTICDLGQVMVESGYQQCQFTFTVAGEDEVSIVGALSACGCTIPSYPKQPLRPGENGTVSVTYDTAGRPTGTFDKTITLITTAQPERITLHIKGEAVSMSPQSTPFF